MVFNGHCVSRSTHERLLDPCVLRDLWYTVRLEASDAVIFLYHEPGHRPMSPVAFSCLPSCLTRFIRGSLESAGMVQ